MNHNLLYDIGKVGKALQKPNLDFLGFLEKPKNLY